MKGKGRFLVGSSVSLIASLPPPRKPIPEGMVTTTVAATLVPPRPKDGEK